MLTIDMQTARRFILGRQGIWPGRRWRGVEGVEAAMQAMEYLQLDPLQIIARSQDIALNSRVVDYQPEQWEMVTYEHRKFFDWGGWLAVRPMTELPYWRVVMHRERDGHPDYEPRVAHILVEHADAIEEMRELLEQYNTLSNRQFEMQQRKRTESYRGRKDSAIALYYLWRTGDVMTHHRQHFERVYALTKHVAPADLLYEASDDDADSFILMKEIAFWGLAPLKRTSDAYYRGVPFSRKQALLDALLRRGEIIEVKVAGWKMPHYALANDAETLTTLLAGQLPAGWEPLDTDTTDEAVFLAPLDQTVARGRAKALFDFDYTWEVYTPAAKRKFGYYALPILWNDQLAGRFDSKLDRTTNTLLILGLWLEDAALGADSAFTQALAKGFERFTRFLGAQQINAQGIEAPLLRRAVEG